MRSSAPDDNFTGSASDISGWKLFLECEHLVWPAVTGGMFRYDIDGLVHDCSISTGNTLGILQLCTTVKSLINIRRTLVGN